MDVKGEGSSIENALAGSAPRRSGLPAEDTYSSAVSKL